MDHPHNERPAEEGTTSARNSSGRRRFALATLGIGLFALLLNVFTPLVADDWGRAASSTSLSRVLSNSWRFYFEWDGRLINSILGNSTFLLPPFLFDVMNAAILSSLMLLIYLIAAPRRGFSVSTLLLSFFLTWLFLPAFGHVVLWQLGSVIYLWASVQIFVLIWLFQRFVAREVELGIPAAAQAATLFLLGLMAGNAAQHGSGGALLILSGYMIALKVKRRRVPSWMLFGWLGTAAGLAAAVLAPGNSLRAENFVPNSPSPTHAMFAQVDELVTRHFQEMGGLMILVAALLAVYLSMPRREWHTTLTASLLTGAAFATTFAMLAAPPGTASNRTLSFGAFFLVAAAVVLMSGIVEAVGAPAVAFRRAVAAGLSVAVIYSAIPAVHDAWLMWSYDRARMSHVVAEREAGRLDVTVYRIPVPKSPYRADHLLGDLAEDPNFWRNQGFSQYMRINSVSAPS